MRKLGPGVLVCMIISIGAAIAMVPEAEVTAPIKKFLDSFNKGDAEGAAATHAAVADLSIVDEVPPFHWRGADAFKVWSKDLENDSKKRGITDQAVALDAPTRVETDGERAYVVVPAVYSFKERGKAMREAAQMAFVLKKGSGGWLIHAWTWTGPKPQAAGGAPAKP